METVHGFAAAQDQRVPRLTSSHTQLSPVDSAVPNALQPTVPSPLLPATVHTEYPLPCPHSPLSSVMPLGSYSFSPSYLLVVPGG